MICLRLGMVDLSTAEIAVSASGRHTGSGLVWESMEEDLNPPSSQELTGSEKLSPYSPLFPDEPLMTLLSISILQSGWRDIKRTLVQSWDF